jgi:hypothetical protein
MAGGTTERGSAVRMPMADQGMDRAGGGQMPQRAQAYGMPQMQQPAYQNSGLARFGAGFNPYMPQAYQPRVYQPRPLAQSRGLLTPQPVAQGIGNGLMGAPGGEGAGAGASTGANAPGQQGIDPNGFSMTANQAVGMVASPVGTVATGIATGFANAVAQANAAEAAMNAEGVTNPSSVNAVNGMDSASDDADAANAASPDASAANSVNGMDSASDTADGSSGTSGGGGGGGGGK